MRSAGLLALALGLSLGCGDPVVEADAGFVEFDGAPACLAGQVLCLGLCVNTDNNAMHCGQCERACPSGQFCSNGECSASCGSLLRACGASCVDVSMDLEHCGDCNRRCDDGLICSNGDCQCPGDQLECDGRCVNELEDPMNCGICNRRCNGEQTCINGSCECENGGILCGTTCVDEQNDVNHCGDCNIACEADEFCNGGECACNGGDREADCSDEADDDCDTLIDCEDPDCHGQTRTCVASGSGMCSMGIQLCDPNGTWGLCEVGEGTPEICGDGIDQDCDGFDQDEPDDWEYNDTCGTCAFVTAAIDPTITINPSFDSVADEADCFLFTVSDGASPFLESIDIELTDIPVGHDYDVYLYRNFDDCEARAPIASSTGVGNVNETISWTEPFGTDDGGTYYVRVRRYSGYECGSFYTLRFDGLR